jgi:hypothetical protein
MKSLNTRSSLLVFKGPLGSALGIAPHASCTMSWHRHRLAASISRFLHVTSYIKGCLGLGGHAVVPAALPDLVPGCMSMHTAPVRLQGSVRDAINAQGGIVGSRTCSNPSERINNHAAMCNLNVFKRQGDIYGQSSCQVDCLRPSDAICVNGTGKLDTFGIGLTAGSVTWSAMPPTQCLTIDPCWRRKKRRKGLSRSSSGGIGIQMHRLLDPLSHRFRGVKVANTGLRALVACRA